MGTEIAQYEFELEHFTRFAERIRLETTLLQQLLATGKVKDDGFSSGMELEAWIVDDKGAPLATNQWLLSCINHPQVVTELSRYNIEVNSTPFPCQSQSLHSTLRGLNEIWGSCLKCAESQNSRLVMIGTLPTAKRMEFPKKIMAPRKRYEALNHSLFGENRMHRILINGEKDQLNMQTRHIMPASAATSVQFHFEVPASKFVEYFNISQFVSAFTVALSANAPLLFGKELWDESRIPLFEHSINSAPSDSIYKSLNRSFFGDGYLDRSVLELFEKNLNNYPVLLPAELSDNPMDMAHLNLHNGTIWRWNRPVVGHTNGQVHLRIEHRVPSSGPTLVDSVANLAFYLGLVHGLAEQDSQVFHKLSHRLVSYNFYRAAQRSLLSNVMWINGQKRGIAPLISQELLPIARLGMKKLKYSDDEISYFLDSIIANRLKNMQNGATWQKAFASKYGKDYKALVDRYIELQLEGKPVHTWNLN